MLFVDFWVFEFAHSNWLRFFKLVLCLNKSLRIKKIRKFEDSDSMKNQFFSHFWAFFAIFEASFALSEVISLQEDSGLSGTQVNLWVWVS